MELLSNITEEQFEVIQFLNKFTKGKWSLNEKTGLVDIEGNFNCSGITLNKGSRKKLKDFSGVRFGVVTGDFGCSFNELTSLEGAPQEVGRNFNCEGNELTSIKGAPQEVGGHFLCSDNKITSLEGAPKKVDGFYCSGNKLTSLEGAPRVVKGNFCCCYNELTSLEGAPRKVEGLSNFSGRWE